jgi:hypothetical protein
MSHRISRDYAQSIADRLPDGMSFAMFYENNKAKFQLWYAIKCISKSLLDEMRTLIKNLADAAIETAKKIEAAWPRQE